MIRSAGRNSADATGRSWPRCLRRCASLCPCAAERHRAGLPLPTVGDRELQMVAAPAARDAFDGDDLAGHGSQLRLPGVLPDADHRQRDGETDGDPHARALRHRRHAHGAPAPATCAVAAPSPCAGGGWQWLIVAEGVSPRPRKGLRMTARAFGQSQAMLPPETGHRCSRGGAGRRQHHEGHRLAGAAGAGMRSTGQAIGLERALADQPEGIGEPLEAHHGEAVDRRCRGRGRNRRLGGRPRPGRRS